MPNFQPAIPARSSNASPGSVFAQKIWNVPMNQAREDAIFAEFLQGNVPNFLRKPVQIDVMESGNTVSYFVLPDVLSIGSDDDYIRVPMNPLTAQKICDLYGCLLPTTKMSDQIWHAATMKLNPAPKPPTAEMSTVHYFVEHNQTVQGQLSNHNAMLGQLVAGHKKDVVLSLHSPYPTTRVCIYGWHQSNGSPIQSLNYVSHSQLYSDYSHGIRLILDVALLNGQQVSLSDLMKDPTYSGLISKEGPLQHTSYL